MRILSEYVNYMLKTEFLCKSDTCSNSLLLTCFLCWTICSTWKIRAPNYKFLTPILLYVWYLHRLSCKKINSSINQKACTKVTKQVFTVLLLFSPLCKCKVTHKKNLMIWRYPHLRVWKVSNDMVTIFSEEALKRSHKEDRGGQWNTDLKAQHILLSLCMKISGPPCPSGIALQFCTAIGGREQRKLGKKAPFEFVF